MKTRSPMKTMDNNQDNDLSPIRAHVRQAIARVGRRISESQPDQPIKSSKAGSSKIPFALPIDEFLKTGQQSVEWLVSELIPRGGLVILAARPKVGKSILSLNLALGLRRGSFLGRDCRPAKTLIIQLEDMPPLIRERFNKMGPENGIFVRAGLSWCDRDLSELNDFIVKNKIDLVIIDQLIFAVGSADENDASKMGNFFKRLRGISFKADTTILVIHHHRKTRGNNGDAIRGSSAIFGAVDIALELARENETSPTATLSGTSRFGAIEPVVLTLDEETLTWHSQGSAQGFKQTKRERDILKALEDHNQEMDCPALESALGLKASNFMPALKRLVKNGLVTERKETTRGRPRSYFSPILTANPTET